MAVSLGDLSEPLDAKPLAWTRPQTRWTEPRKVDLTLAQRLTEQLHLPPLVATLLVARGLSEDDDAHRDQEVEPAVALPDRCFGAQDVGSPAGPQIHLPRVRGPGRTCPPPPVGSVSVPRMTG